MVTDNFTINELWIEKYRPKTIDDLVIDDSFRETLKQYIDTPEVMNHQLYIGPPGSGKTTTARILIDHILKSKDDLLVLNGSEQKGIQIIREHVKDFVKTPAMFSPIKIVFIDEADNLTPDAWKSLRFIMENFSSNARFIYTGNYDTFPDYIKSRSSIRKFISLDKDYVYNFVINILQNENITYNEDDVKYIINIFYPDLRKIVSALQELSIRDKRLDISNIEQITSAEDKLVTMTITLIKHILSGQNANSIIIDIFGLVSTRYIDYSKVYKTLFRTLSFEAIPIKVIIAKYANKLSYVLEPSMSYVEFISELVNKCQELLGTLNPSLITIGDYNVTQ